MYNKTKDKSLISNEVQNYISKKLTEYYNDVGIYKVEDYTRINDSDKPGIVESIEISVGMDKFEVVYYHNDDFQSFKKV